MKMHSMKCPNCGAKLVEENGFDAYVCKHCGVKVVLEGRSKAAINAEVRFKEMEHKERMQREKYEHEKEMISEMDEYDKKRSKRKRKGKNTWIVVLVLVLFTFLIICGVTLYTIGAESDRKHEELVKELKRIEDLVDKEIENKEYELALSNAKKLILDDNYSGKEEETWEKKREDYIERIEALIESEHESDPNYTYVPQSSDSLESLSGEEAKSVLEKAGFTNIEMQEVKGSSGLFGKDNQVEHIVIGGKSEFSNEYLIKKDSRIIIYYYEE